MPVALKQTNALSALEKLGFSEFELKTIVEVGISCKLTANEFQFLLLDIEHGPYGVSVPVSLDDLMLLKNGKLPDGKKKHLKGCCQEVIDSLAMKVAKGEVQKINAAKAHKTFHIDLAKKDDEQIAAIALSLKGAFQQVISKKAVENAGEFFTEGMDMPGALELLKKAKITPKPKPPTINVGMAVNAPWSEFPDHMKKSAPLVQLRQATQMYQPVAGTSAGSRYYVVAANEDLRVAARFSGGTLSVRVEGKGWDKYKSQLSAAGFGKVSTSKQYASLHLDVGHDKVMASKTLGAVLLGLGIPMQTPLPDINKVPKG